MRRFILCFWLLLPCKQEVMLVLRAYLYLLGKQLFYAAYYAPTSLERGHYEMKVSVYLSVCRMPRPNSRTKRPRKPKIGMMEAHYTSNL